jgi:hypothetical protein
MANGGHHPMPTFTCPRCGAEVTDRFYGPCADCRSSLRLLEAPARDPRFVRTSDNEYRDRIEFRP